MGRKKRYGNLQHGAKKIGGFAINDLFDDPGLFIEELGNSPWVTPGAPDKSGLLTLLTRFQGPMYKIFDDDDLATWREWVVWLAKEGDTPAPKEYIGKGEAMLLLLTELRELAISEQGHTRYKLDDAHTSGGSTAEAPERQTIADWFREPDLKILMRALADPKNGWVVPSRADLSPLVVDMLQGNRRMGRVLNQRFACVGNEIGRLVVVRWVRAGCPIPGEAPPAPEEARPIKPQRIQRLLVQQYGMGAVH
jgi:hypothetical protein